MFDPSQGQQTFFWVPRKAVFVLFGVCLFAYLLTLSSTCVWPSVPPTRTDETNPDALLFAPVETAVISRG